MKEQGFTASEKVVKFLFHVADRNGNNYLDKKEFGHFFTRLVKLENADIYDLIALAMDQNEDGKVS